MVLYTKCSYYVTPCSHTFTQGGELGGASTLMNTLLLESYHLCCSTQPITSTLKVVSKKISVLCAHLPVHPWNTSHTAGASACWPCFHDRRWHWDGSKYGTRAPSWQWWRVGQWWGMAPWYPRDRFLLGMWWTGWSFPGPSRLPGCSSAWQMEMTRVRGREEET